MSDKIISQLDSFFLPKGTVVKVNGIPVRLHNKSLVCGNEADYRLSLSQAEHFSSSGPDHAASPDN